MEVQKDVRSSVKGPFGANVTAIAGRLLDFDSTIDSSEIFELLHQVIPDCKLVAIEGREMADCDMKSISASSAKAWQQLFHWV